MYSVREEKNSRSVIIAEDIDLRAVTALEYAKVNSENIIVFSTFSNPDDEQCYQQDWKEITQDIPLILRYSQDGGITAPLLAFLQSPEYGLEADETVKVYLPRLAETKWWHRLLDNHVSKYIERTLSTYRQIQVVVVPVMLEGDESALYDEAHREETSCRR